VETNRKSFECKRCHKQYTRAEDLNKHLKKCCKCIRCSEQFLSIPDLVSHPCNEKGKQVEEADPVDLQKETTRRQQNFTFFDENEKFETTDKNLQAIIDKHWSSIRSFIHHGQVQDLYNLQLLSQTLDELIVNLEDRIMSDQHNRLKINYSFRFILQTLETEELRYYHPSYGNSRMMDAATLISNRDELYHFLTNILEEDFPDPLTRPDTKWRLSTITNIVFYVNKLKDAPIGSSVNLPNYLKNNRGLANFFVMTICVFFRCLSVFLGSFREDCERFTQQLFLSFCHKFGVDKKESNS